MSHNDVIASSTYNGAPPPLLRDYEQHKGLMHSRWFFDWYLSNPVRSKLHLITAIKLQKNVNDLEWLSDIDEETGTFVGLLATISTIHIPHNAKYEAALRDVLLAFSQAASQIATAVTVVPVSDGPEKEKQRFTAALERQLTLSPVWSVNLDFYRGAQISAPVNCRNNRRYFVDGLAVLLEKATGDIQHLLLDDTVLNSLFPVVFDDSAPLSDVVWPMLLPHEQYLIKKDPRARELIARVVRGAVLAFGFVPKIPDADDDPAVSSLLDFELADAAEVAEATDWIRYQWVREAGPTLTRMVAFLVATDFRDVAYALVTVVCKTYGGQKDIADTVRSGLEPFFSQDKAATLDRLLPEW